MTLHEPIPLSLASRSRHMSTCTLLRPSTHGRVKRKHTFLQAVGRCPVRKDTHPGHILPARASSPQALLHGAPQGIHGVVSTLSFFGEGVDDVEVLLLARRPLNIVAITPA